MSKNKKIEGLGQNILDILVFTFLSALTGFGYFSLSRIIGWGIYFSIFMGMCVSALVMGYFITYKILVYILEKETKK